MGDCCQRLLWEAFVRGCCGRLLWETVVGGSVGGSVGGCCGRFSWEAALGGRCRKRIQQSLHICNSYDTTSDFSVAPSPAETWK